MTSALEIAESTTRMPDFWDRQVVFFANLFEIFYENREKTEALAAVVGPSRSYGGRFTPALNLLYKGPDNLLVLEEEPSPMLCDYFADDLGLSLPEVLVMPARDYRTLAPGNAGTGADSVDRVLNALMQRVQRSKTPERQWIDGFVTDPTLLEIGRRLGLPTTTTQEGSRRGNNKWLLYQYLRNSGWPSIPTELAGSSSGIVKCLDSLGRQGFTEAVVKSQLGASGIGLRKLDIARDRTVSFPSYFFTEGPCMVQGWLRPGENGIVETLSPSVQFFLADKRAVVFDITEQLLTGRILHAGNQSPPPYLGTAPHLRATLLEQSAEALRWLHAQGYRGFGGLDFLVAERGDGREPDVYVSEINARVTAATYPSILVRRLFPGARWMLRNVEFGAGETEKAILRRLRGTGQLFLPGRPGIIPLNFSPSEDGTPEKGQFLSVGESGREFLEQALGARVIESVGLGKVDGA